MLAKMKPYSYVPNKRKGKWQSQRENVMEIDPNGIEVLYSAADKLFSKLIEWFGVSVIRMASQRMD
jgi:hypothetical protein